MIKRSFLFGIPVALLVMSGPIGTTVNALTGPAVLDDWGNRFRSLGTSVPENPLRTQVRTTIAQLAMFDAVMLTVFKAKNGTCEVAALTMQPLEE